MSFDILAALVLFAFVTSVTPGPNNLMLMASGANFGFRRTVPHMLGISLGHAFMVLLVGFGIAGLFVTFPVAKTALKIVSVVYMVWLAWKIAYAAAPGEGASTGKPMTFLQASAFQWVNPKAWAMALGATSAYAPAGTVQTFALVAMVFAAVNLPSVAIWARAGQELRRLLTNPSRLRGFNWTMSGLLIASLIPVLRM